MKAPHVDIDTLRTLTTAIVRELGFAILQCEEANALRIMDWPSQVAETLGFASNAARNASEAMHTLEQIIERKAAKAEAAARKARARKGRK